jgi:hypothetical protein
MGIPWWASSIVWSIISRTRHFGRCLYLVCRWLLVVLLAFFVSISIMTNFHLKTWVKSPPETSCISKIPQTAYSVRHSIPIMDQSSSQTLTECTVKCTGFIITVITYLLRGASVLVELWQPHIFYVTFRDNNFYGVGSSAPRPTPKPGGPGYLS